MRERPGIRTAARPLVLCVTTALAGCGGGGGGDDPPMSAADDPPTSATPQDDALPGAGADEPPMPDDPVDAAEGSDAPEASPPETTAPVDPDGDDVSGLVVEGLSGQSPDEAFSPWLVNATFVRSAANTPGSGDALIGLLGYGDALPVRTYVDFFTRELDACELNRDGGGTGTAGGSGSGGRAPPGASGGTSVTINTPAGPWFVLDAVAFGEDGTDVRYATNDGLPGPLPSDATLSIPGDAFPNVAAFALPDEPEAPVRLLPDTGDRLGLDTAYGWVPGDGGSDYVEMQFVALDATTGDRIDFPIVCAVIDDGSFTLPDEARTFLATTTDDVRMRYVRTRDVLTLADGIVFKVRVAVAE